MGELLKAVDGGDRRKVLQVLAREIAAAIESTSDGTKIAALALRLDQVTQQIDGLPDQEETNPFDELTERRRARISDSEDSVDPRVPVKRRQGGRRARVNGGSDT